jgi:hypothetical protein
MFISDNIQSKKFEVYHSSIALNRYSSNGSYFLFIIIFTKKFAKSKSCFLAFFSSFCVLFIHEEALFTASLNTSETSQTLSLEFQIDGQVSSQEKSSKDIF